MQNPDCAAIRQAIATGQFQLAERQWNTYAGRLREELNRGCLTAASLAEAGELVEWSRTTVQCIRAHAQARLGGLHIAGAYGEAPQTQPARLIHTCL